MVHSLRYLHYTLSPPGVTPTCSTSPWLSPLGATPLALHHHHGNHPRREEGGPVLGSASPGVPCALLGTPQQPPCTPASTYTHGCTASWTYCAIPHSTMHSSLTFHWKPAPMCCHWAPPTLASGVQTSLGALCPGMHRGRDSLTPDIPRVHRRQHRECLV